MMRSVLRGMTVLLATSGLVVPAIGSASAATDDHSVRQQTVTVVGNGRSVHLSTDSIRAGSTRFRVSSTNPQNPGGGGSEITLFRLKPGKTLSAFFTGVREEFSQNPRVAARGTRDLVATAIARGLADVVPGSAETVTETLQPGTYYAMDLGTMPANGRPVLSTLHVRPGDAETDVASDFRVTTVDDRFSAPRVWPHKGTYTFVNESDTIHFALIVPIKPHTTDRDVQAFFDAARNGKTNVPPPFASGPTGGNDVVSPGYRLKLSYDLPAGRYVLLCYVADDITGLPHAFMGMHQVVDLK